MSHQPLREEKNCLNCGHTVPERYCPNCGQENIINRPSFHHLFTHFFADLFHYDSGFWRTMKTLLFKPGKIVRDYLDGKRKTYVEPVKLYIFVSFVAFFLPHFLPDYEDSNQEKLSSSEQVQRAIDNFEGVDFGNFTNVKSVEQLDSLQNLLPPDQRMSEEEYKVATTVLDSIEKYRLNALDGFNLDFKNLRISTKDGVNFGQNYRKLKSVAQFDSVHATLPKEKRMGWLMKPMARKAVELKERDLYKNEDLGEKFRESFMKNLPKATFIYLPIFAFFLWLFHSKKKWLYYDHGIFTLYLFSATLIFMTLRSVIEALIFFPTIWWKGAFGTIDFIGDIITFAFIVYMVFYFFRSHHRTYQESAWTSRFKCLMMGFVNTFILFFVVLIYTIITFMVI